MKKPSKLDGTLGDLLLCLTAIGFTIVLLTILFGIGWAVVLKWGVAGV